MSELKSEQVALDHEPFVLHRGMVGGRFPLTDPVIRGVYAKGDSAVDFLANAGEVLRTARDQVRTETGSPACETSCHLGREGHCRLTVGWTLSMTRGHWRPEDPAMPEADASLHIECDNGMVSPQSAFVIGAEPGDLLLQTGVNLEPYKGDDVLDDGCRAEMRRVAARVGALVHMQQDPTSRYV